jgi:hypothetical protein
MEAMTAAEFWRYVAPPVIALAYLVAVYVTRQLLIRQSATTLVAYVERLRGAYHLPERLEEQLRRAVAASERHSKVDVPLLGALLRRRSEDQVLCGWRLSHGVEPILVRDLDISREQMTVRLLVIGPELAKSPIEGRAEVGRRMLEAVRPAPSGDPAVNDARLRALLAEGLGQTYDARDDYFDGIVQESKRTTWLTCVGLATIVLLALAFGRQAFFLLGAVGGSFSRLTRVLRRRPEPTDYGVSWGPLMLGPVAGALAAWIGMLVLSVLQAAGLSPLNDALNPNWNHTVVSKELGLAFLLGFSERFLQRVLTSATDRATPPPEAQPVVSGGSQPEPGPSAPRR